MKNDTIANPGKDRQATRKAVDTPPAAGGKAHFNPLHPSMELPPEQLIRLLGVESKKTRRQDKSCRQQEVAPRQPKNDTIANLGKDRQATRKAVDATPAAGGKAHFNPLHPSMELPPEQLIRLLSVESKKTRRRSSQSPHGPIN
jgi:hypothetical protein